MRIFLKVDSIADSLGNNFILSSDIGSLVPNSAIRQELLGGVELQADPNSNSITISTEFVNPPAQITQNIDKTTENCVDLNITADPVSIVI